MEHSPPSGRFAGLRVAVTGGTSGLGLALVREFLGRGARVAFVARTPGRVERVAREHPGAHGVVGDVSVKEDVHPIAVQIVGELGGLDVLVNNAGIYAGHPVTGTSYEDWQAAWQETLGVNLFGAANATWCAVRHMIDGARGGKIVNVGSRGAYRGEPAHPAYGASKAGLHALGQSLAVALAPHGITVASVAPGYVATDMTAEELGTSAGDAIRAQSPFGRVATAAEVAAAVVYLASPEAEWASGAVLDLNGASYLR
jgi:NAD(P)-dependent dehydrogenase (short-subunit alcohol dehydrogenase family)